AVDPATSAGVLQATITTSVYDAMGQLLTNTVVDAPSSSLLSSRIASNPDAFGRMQKTTYLDGTSDQSFQACCGTSSTIDRDGVTTTYQYDGLKRLVATARLTNTTVFNAAGNVLMTIRSGTDGSRITNSWSGYDIHGRLASLTNAFGGVTQ